MTNKIRLNRRELQQIYGLFNKLNESNELGSIVLEECGDSGIGNVLTATVLVTHRDIEGNFVVTISDESDW